MKYRRGQAALEFLSTYGFAFLIILVMVGALTYFGVLNPSGLVPNKCLAGNGIECTEARITRPGPNQVVVDIALDNNRGTTTTLGFPAAAGLTALNFPGYGAGLGAGALPANCALAGTVNCAGYSTTVGPTTFPTSQAAPGSTLSPGSRIYLHADYSPGATVTFPARGEKLRLSVAATYQDAGSAFAQPLSIDITQTLS